MASAVQLVKNHVVELRDRGGEQVYFQFDGVDSVDWSRVRDDTSVANVHVNAAADDSLADKLAKATPLRHEATIWRDGKNVWEGPLRTVAYDATGCTFAFSDITYYIYRLVLSQGYSNAYPDVAFVTDRIAAIIEYELERKDTAELALGLPSVNVLPFLVNHRIDDTDAKTSAVTVPYQYTVWEHLDNLAAQSGIDYVALGRALHLWDTSKPVMGYTPHTTQADFLGALTVTKYGSDLATKTYATDGQGNAGSAGDVDPYFGLVEILDTAYDEDTAQPGDPVPSVAELASQAQRNLSGRNPVPLQVRVPDNSAINPEGVLNTDNLVPGVYVPLDITVGVLQTTQMQKLTSMRVTEKAGSETTTVVLYPASSPDVEDV